MGAANGRRGKKPQSAPAQGPRPAASTSGEETSVAVKPSIFVIKSSGIAAHQGACTPHCAACSTSTQPNRQHCCPALRRPPWLGAWSRDGMRVLLLAAALVLLAVGQAQAAPSPFATFKSKREARAAFAQFESGLAQHKVGQAAARVGTQPLAEPGMPASIEGWHKLAPLGAGLQPAARAIPGVPEAARARVLRR